MEEIQGNHVMVNEDTTKSSEGSPAGGPVPLDSMNRERRISWHDERTIAWAKKWAIIGIGSGEGGIILLLLLMGCLDRKWVWMLPSAYYGYAIALLLLPALAGVIIWKLFGRGTAGLWITEPLKSDWIMTLGIAGLVIGILMAIAVPSSVRVSKSSLCGMSEYRMIDAAKDQYALVHNVTNHVVVRWADLAPYLPPFFVQRGGMDRIGNQITIGRLYEPVRVNPQTKKILEDATGGDTFWGPYS